MGVKLCLHVTFAFVCASACASRSMSPLALSGWKRKHREWVPHPFSPFDANTDVTCKQFRLVPWNPFMTFHVDANANVTCKQSFTVKFCPDFLSKSTVLFASLLIFLCVNSTLGMHLTIFWTVRETVTLLAPNPVVVRIMSRFRVPGIGEASLWLTSWQYPCRHGLALGSVIGLFGWYTSHGAVFELLQQNLHVSPTEKWRAVGYLLLLAYQSINLRSFWCSTCRILQDVLKSYLRRRRTVLSYALHKRTNTVLLGMFLCNIEKHSSWTTEIHISGREISGK